MVNVVSPNQIQVQIGLVLFVWPDTHDDTSQPCIWPYAVPIEGLEVVSYDVHSPWTASDDSTKDTTITT